VEICAQGPGAPAGLVGYWPFDGDANAVIGVNGIMVGNPVPALDRNNVAGGALFFDGTLQQNVNVPGGGGLNGARQGTISMWVKWTGNQDLDNVALGAAGAVLSRQQNGSFSDNIINLSSPDPSTALIQWRQNNPGQTNITSTAFVASDWHHIAVTFTETNSELFVDGFSEGTGPGGALHDNPATALILGAWGGDGGSFATAAIDDVAIWNRVLTADEIQLIAGQLSTPLNLLIAPDCLTVRRSGNDVVVQWGSQTVLQSAIEITGPYSDVTDPAAPPPGYVSSPYTTTASDPRRFYRLRSP
jgi:hypothetical protein